MKRGHKDLRAWQASMQLVEMVYRLTSTFPREEQFGITAQMRRAAISIPSNIAEGAARQGTKEFLRFLSIASGSLAELDTQLELAARLQLCADIGPVTEKADETAALLLAMAKALREKP